MSSGDLVENHVGQLRGLYGILDVVGILQRDGDEPGPDELVVG